MNILFIIYGIYGHMYKYDQFGKSNWQNLESLPMQDFS